MSEGNKERAGSESFLDFMRRYCPFRIDWTPEKMLLLLEDPDNFPEEELTPCCSSECPLESLTLEIEDSEESEKSLKE